MNTIAAKNITAGQWVAFGSMAWMAGSDAVTEDGVTYIDFGHTASEFKPNQRLTVHAEA